MRRWVAPAAALWAVLAMAPALAPVAAAAANPAPVQTLRLEDGAELWTIPYPALQQFIDDGSFADQRLKQLVARSGWPEDQLRVAMAKLYSVELVGDARKALKDARSAKVSLNSELFFSRRSVCLF